MDELNYPELPPGHSYKKKGNKVPGTHIANIGYANDVDIYEGDWRDSENEYSRRLRAFVAFDTDSGQFKAIIRERHAGKIVWREYFSEEQAALNIVVAHLWLGTFPEN